MAQELLFEISQFIIQNVRTLRAAYSLSDQKESFESFIRQKVISDLNLKYNIDELEQALSDEKVQMVLDIVTRTENENDKTNKVH